mmetsp:Transcript_70537/g.181820  ORF Transcript_70537/g.181820 Transcript_70537/m.181820 type:complete len:589 (+) Transcript_70537:350-2116(+)
MLHCNFQSLGVAHLLRRLHDLVEQSLQFLARELLERRRLRLRLLHGLGAGLLRLVRPRLLRLLLDARLLLQLARLLPVDLDAPLQRLLLAQQTVVLLLEGARGGLRLPDVRGQGLRVAAQEEGLHHDLHHGDADRAAVKLFGAVEHALVEALGRDKLVGDVLRHGNHVEDYEEQRQDTGDARGEHAGPRAAVVVARQLGGRGVEGHHAGHKGPEEHDEEVPHREQKPRAGAEADDLTPDAAAHIVLHVQRVLEQRRAHQEQLANLVDIELAVPNGLNEVTLHLFGLRPDGSLAVAEHDHGGRVRDGEDGSEDPHDPHPEPEAGHPTSHQRARRHVVVEGPCAHGSDRNEDNNHLGEVDEERDRQDHGREEAGQEHRHRRHADVAGAEAQEQHGLLGLQLPQQPRNGAVDLAGQEGPGLDGEAVRMGLQDSLRFVCLGQLGAHQLDRTTCHGLHQLLGIHRHRLLGIGLELSRRRSRLHRRGHCLGVLALLDGLVGLLPRHGECRTTNAREDEHRNSTVDRIRGRAVLQAVKGLLRQERHVAPRQQRPARLGHVTNLEHAGRLAGAGHMAHCSGERCRRHGHHRQQRYE